MISQLSPHSDPIRLPGLAEYRFWAEDPRERGLVSWNLPSERGDGGPKERTVQPCPVVQDHPNELVPG